MASVWIQKYATRSGANRFRVLYRIGGRESSPKHGGSFKRKQDSIVRAAWISGELAAMRVPDMRVIVEPVQAATFSEAAEHWRASRVDVSEGTSELHRVALNRALPTIGTVRVDELTAQHFVDLIAALAAGGSKRETIRKTWKYAASVLDDLGIEPNPARDRRVRLPYEEEHEVVPPEAEHVEAVFDALASVYRLPLLWLDWSGARVSSVETVLVGDYDQALRRVRLRKSVTKTRAALWVELPDALAEAIEANLPHPKFRDLDAQLFSDVTGDRLRTAIARACKTVGVPVFSPHDLGHRRISVLHRQGRTWAEIARFVGQRKLSITADTYTHVLVDGREADYQALLARSA